jgi:hypothetical protein
MGNVNFYGPATLVNAGVISGNVYLWDGGSVTNIGPGGVISGRLVISSAPGTVTNSGAILGLNRGYGVMLLGGGTLTNLAGGLINSYDKTVLGFDGDGHAIVVVNDGTILSRGRYGVYLQTTGSITNGANALIQGGRAGIALFGAGSTIDNFGTILGTGGTAVALQNGNETLTIEPGSQILGAIAGFQGSDTLDLVDTQATDLAFSNGTLTVLDNGVTVASLAIPQPLSATKFAFTADGHGGIDITLAAPSSQTITGEYGAGLVLSNPATQNPTTIAANGTISPVSGVGVLGLASTAWTLTNLGTIAALSTDGGGGGVNGVELQSGGLVSNGASGVIRGSNHGVQLDAGGSVMNRGLIAGSGGFVLNMYYNSYLGSRTITAHGEASAGVLLNGTGNLVNYGTVLGFGYTAVSVNGWYGNNFIPAINTQRQSGIGAGLAAGGSITNAAGGLIQGNYRGIDVTGGAGAVTNAGSIVAAHGAGVRLDAGGSLLNSGRIAGTGTGLTETFYFGYNRLPIAANLYGQTGGAGVVLNGSGDVVNSGTILGSGFSIVTTYQVGGYGPSGALISDNASGVGVDLLAGGSVTNTAGGLIEGNDRGVDITGARGTVVNAGAIVGGVAGAAIHLDSSVGGLVVVDPGAVFVGTVSGGNASASTLELASAASAGTLSGLGTQFVDFGSIAVDPGATWLLAGNNTVAHGATLTNAGSLSFTGTLDDAGALIGTGGMAISFAGAGSLLVIEQDAVIHGTIGGFLPGETIDLLGIAATGATLGANNVLSVQASGGGTVTLDLATNQNYAGYGFTVGSDGHGGSDISVVLRDPGPTALNGATALGHGQTADLTGLIAGLVSPGVPGDTETIIAATATTGTANVTGGVVTYTAPASGPATINYTVQDQFGDTATGSVTITVDTGPVAATGATTLGHGKTVDLTAAIAAFVQPGLAGDSETVKTISAAHGVASVTLAGVVTYTAPSSGTDTLGYTVADQYGDTASGTLNVTVDRGPTAGAAAITLLAGQSTDLTAYLLSLVTPGIAGDVLILSGDNTVGTHGMVTLTSGDLSYLAPSATGTDSFGYTVSDQYGDIASATVTVTIASSSNIGNSSGTVVLGDTSGPATFGNGSVTVIGGNGSDQVSGGNGTNSVTLGNGNDTVVLGNGSNNITLGTGNDSVTVGNNSNTITVIGSATSVDTIVVGNGSNTLNLGAGTYNVTEGNGADTIILGNGKYNVTAGNGSPDLFIYTTPSALLTMSYAGNDALVFRNSGFDLGVDNGLGTLSLQTIAAALFSPNTDGTFATAANRFAYNAANGDLYYDASGSAAGSSRVLIADLTNHPHLTAASLFFTS